MLLLVNAITVGKYNAQQRERILDFVLTNRDLRSFEIRFEFE